METAMSTGLEETNLIAAGARGDEERRRRHGVKTTFVRVFEAHVDALRLADAGSAATDPAGTDPAGAVPRSPAGSAGEFRVIGKPASADEAVAVVRAAIAAAGKTPVTAFSLVDLFELGGQVLFNLGELAKRLRNAGLQAIAEFPIDVLPEGVTLPLAQVVVKAAGLRVPRLTVREAGADARDRLIALATEVQAVTGGNVRAFAPLPRVTSLAQPSTGYDDVKTIAAARLGAHNIDSIQVDWALYGPKLAQVALTMGADDVDGVSPLEGDLGRRRSPIEEIRGNIKAAGLEPIERDGFFGRKG
jgi:aminodeoxyfutalosine synthase